MTQNCWPEYLTSCKEAVELLKNYNINLDVRQSIAYTPAEFVAGDINVNQITVHLMDRGAPFDLTGRFVTATIRKADGTVVVGDCTIEDPLAGRVSYLLGSNDVAAPGDATATIEVYEGANRLTSSQFRFRIRAQLDDGNGISSTTDYPVLNRLIEYLSDLDGGEFGVDPEGEFDGGEF